MVNVNKQWYNYSEKLAKSYEKDVLNNWHPQGTDWNAIVMHEIGHGINGYLGGVNYKKYATKIKRETLKKAGLKNKNIHVQMGLSEYATYNTREFFAEAFAEFMCSKTPRAIAKVFGEIITPLLK